jgi:hypothetical protein
MPTPSRNFAYGQNIPFIEVFPFPIYKNTAPTDNDKSFNVGQTWIYRNGDSRVVYVFGGVDSSQNAIWVTTASATGDLSFLQGDSGGAVTPTSQTIAIEGGSNITTVGTNVPGTITIDLDSDITVDQVDVGNLSLFVNRIASNNINGDIILYPNGSGQVRVQYATANSAAVYGTAGALQSIALTNGQLLIGSTGNLPVAANLTSTGGSVTITNTAGGINLEASGSSGGTTWSVVTASTASITDGQGLLCNNATGVTVTLPASAAVGDTFTVVAMGGSGTSFSLAVSTGQSIRFGNTFTTTSSGQLRSTSLGDVCEVVCSVANTAFIVTKVIGNLTVT